MKRSNNVLWGLILILIAGVLVLNQVGISFYGLSVTRICIAVLLVAIMIAGFINRNFGAIFFPMVFLWAIFDDYFGWLHISTWRLIVIAVLLTVGFSIIFPRYRNGRYFDYHRKDYDGKNGAEEQTIINESPNGTIFFDNRFASSVKYVETNNLTGGELINSFGELKVYFDKCQIVNSPIELRIQNSFGAIELFLPKEWQTVLEVNVFAASVNEKNRNASTGSPMIKIYGNCSFGEVAIFYV